MSARDQRNWDATMKRPLVIYGPQGCGKTRMAHAIAARLGAGVVVEGWDGFSPLPANAIATTNRTGRGFLGYDQLSVETLEALLSPALKATTELLEDLRAYEEAELIAHKWGRQ